MIYVIYYISIFIFIIFFGFLIYSTKITDYLSINPIVSIIAFLFFIVGFHHLDDWVNKIAKKRGQGARRQNISIIIMALVFAAVMLIALFTTK